jgi:hypothetical protein
MDGRSLASDETQPPWEARAHDRPHPVRSCRIGLMKRQLLPILKYLLAFVVLLYVGDWGVVRVKMAHQTAFATVQVDQFLGTRLKGQKEEYDYMGAVQQPCVKAIFPHASTAPCWWVERHKTQWEK